MLQHWKKTINQRNKLRENHKFYLLIIKTIFITPANTIVLKLEANTKSQTKLIATTNYNTKNDKISYFYVVLNY